jgi:hypothetical protein
MCLPNNDFHTDFYPDERICAAVSSHTTSRVLAADIPRASYFSYISSTSYVVSFLGPTLASFTMSRNLWLPFWINIALLACAVPIIGMLPVTHQVFTTIASADDDGIVGEVGPLLDGRDTNPDRYANAFEPHPSIFLSIVYAVRKMKRLVTGRWNFQILLCSFFLTALASSDTKLLVQYISKRYEWTFAEVSSFIFLKCFILKPLTFP